MGATFRQFNRCFSTAAGLVAVWSMLSGCSFQTEVISEESPFTRVNSSSLVLVDEKGTKLDAFDGGSSCSKAVDLILQGKRLGATPYYRQLLLNRKLAPISNRNDDSLWLLLPVNKLQQWVANWSAIELPSGEIFISGGDLVDGSFDALNLTWIFSPSTGKIRQGTHMNVSRCNHRMTLLGDGQILITGGIPSLNSETPLRSFELYNSINSKFSRFGEMCLPRAQHSTVSLADGRVLIVGGLTTSSFAEDKDGLTASAELLDTKLCESKLIGFIDPRRYDVQLQNIVGQRRVLIFGGWFFDWKGDDQRVWTIQQFSY